jgi:hypothetical protein
MRIMIALRSWLPHLKRGYKRCHPKATGSSSMKFL